VAGDGLLIPKIAAGDLTVRVTPATVLAVAHGPSLSGGIMGRKGMWKSSMEMGASCSPLTVVVCVG